MSIKIFLDTSVYEKANFSFGNRHFSKLKELIEDSKVELLYNKIVYQEVCQHIKSNVIEAVSCFNQVIKENRAFAPFKYSEKWSNHVMVLDQDEMVSELQKRWDEYLNACNAKEIPINTVDIDDIIERYFNKRYPFENKKPYEFKDAIIVDSIRQFYYSIKNENIFVVAIDKGFRKSLKEDDGIETYADLNVALNHAIQDTENLAIEIERQFESGKFHTFIMKYIDSVAETSSVDIEDVIDDIDVISATCTDIKYEYVYECNVERAIVIAEATIDFIIEYSVRDEENSYYDREEGRYYWEEFIRYRNKFSVVKEIEVWFTIESDEKKVEINIEYENTLIDDNFYLREEDIINSEIIQTSSDYMVDEYDSSASYCPDCGCKITYENDGGAFCIDCAPNH